MYDSLDANDIGWKCYHIAVVVPYIMHYMKYHGYGEDSQFDPVVPWLIFVVDGLPKRSNWYWLQFFVIYFCNVSLYILYLRLVFGFWQAWYGCLGLEVFWVFNLRLEIRDWIWLMLYHLWRLDKYIVCNVFATMGCSV